MPKYILPEREKKSEAEGTAISEPDFDYRRRLYIPANKEIIEALEMGGDVEVKLLGKVTGLEAREGEDFSSHEFTVELDSVEAYTENEFSKLADDD